MLFALALSDLENERSFRLPNFFPGPISQKLPHIAYNNCMDDIKVLVDHFPGSRRWHLGRAQKIFVPQMLTHDHFVVANILFLLVIHVYIYQMFLSNDNVAVTVLSIVS